MQEKLTDKKIFIITYNHNLYQSKKIHLTAIYNKPGAYFFQTLILPLQKIFFGIKYFEKCKEIFIRLHHSKEENFLMMKDYIILKVDSII